MVPVKEASFVNQDGKTGIVEWIDNGVASSHLTLNSL